MPTTLFDFTYNLTTEASQNEVLNALGKNRVKPFEPKSYFFTELSLQEQTTNVGAYGPENGNSTTRFNITTQLQLTNKKAYAVTSGQVLIVPQVNSTDKVNVFIKPLRSIDIGVPIKYFVYRGLKKGMFIDGNNILQYNEQTNTPFIKKVWKDLINFNENISDPPQPGTLVAASLFGFSTSDGSETRLDSKFFNIHDEETTDENKIYSLPIIESGQYFGEFADNEGGFEIVLDNGIYYQEKSNTGFELNLEYAKLKSFALDLSSLSLDVSEKFYKENVLSFLDPVAFYGAHITEEEKGVISIGDSTSKYSSRQDIYENVVNKFYNKNKFYIYIISERARSYNYDETLGVNSLKYGIQGSVQPNSYSTNGWPILIQEFEETHLSDETENKKVFNSITLNLKFKTEEKYGLLHNSHGICTNETINGNFLRQEALVNNEDIATAEYTKDINYKLSNTYNLLSNSSLVAKSIASFIYIRTEERNVEYFNNFFGPINIEPILKPNIQNESTQVIQKAISYNYRFFDDLNYTSLFQPSLAISGKVIPATVTEPEIDNRVRLYVLKKTDSTDLNREFTSYGGSTPAFNFINSKDEYYKGIYGNKNYRVWRGRFTDAFSNQEIRSLKLTNFEGEGNVSSFMQLGLTEIDFNKLVYNSAEIDPESSQIPLDSTNLFFHLENAGVTQGVNYKKYRLGIKYDLFLGLTSVAFPSPENEVYVYTIDGCYFFTKEYAEKIEFAEEFANATVNFRTISQNMPAGGGFPALTAYEGEFGFDWLRLGDNGEPSYEVSITGGYEKPFGIDSNTEFETPSEAYEALKKEYIYLPTQRNNYNYYVPYLNIYPQDAVGTPQPPSTVYLLAKLKVDQAISGLQLNYDKSLFEVETTLPTGPVSASGEVDYLLKITCKKEFEKDQYITVTTTPQLLATSSEPQIAGLIKVCKNSRVANRKQMKVVLVKVKTKVNGISKIGDFNDDEIGNLKKALYQAFIYADIELQRPILNVENDPRFLSGGDFIENGVDIKFYDTNLQPSLQALLGDVYKNHFKVFAFDLEAHTSSGLSVNGNVQDIGIHSVNLYSSRGLFTLCHETMHGLGLYHTHANGLITSKDQKYVYPNANDLLIPEKPKATDNFMSYNGNTRKSTWSWQWKVMHNNIK